MTLATARRRVDEIRVHAQLDHQTAHSKEDMLRRDVLKLIAQGKCGQSRAQDLAKIALSSDKIEFPRWVT